MTAENQTMIFLVFGILLLILSHEFSEKFRILSSIINTASDGWMVVNFGQEQSYDDGPKFNLKSDAYKTLGRRKNTIK